MVRGYKYMMKCTKDITMNRLGQLRSRIVDGHFYENMVKRGNGWYWGWLRFREPLELWDAMELGLVPTFKIERRINEKISTNNDVTVNTT